MSGLNREYTRAASMRLTQLCGSSVSRRAAAAQAGPQGPAGLGEERRRRVPAVVVVVVLVPGLQAASRPPVPRSAAPCAASEAGLSCSVRTHARSWLLPILHQ